MLKANAYGHGAIEIAKATENLVDWFGVATSEEGVELRLNNIYKPILITVFSIKDCEIAVRYNLTPIIYSLEQVLELNQAAESKAKHINIHIKIDTGMNRLGLKSFEEFEELINTVKCLPNIQLEGICTHFYDNDINTLNNQKAVFDRFIYNYKNVICHISSSNTVMIDSKYHYDMVRIGLLAYGYSDYKGFQPVMNVLSEVITIKDVNRSESAGYSGIFKPFKNTRVAVIRGGYYDGVSRNLLGANVIINNNLCKIVAVCMDVTIIEIGNLNIRIGDNVIIIGTMSNNKNTAIELARHSGTIPYEILTNIKGRIERIYYD